MRSSTISPTETCPLCAGDNACAMAAGQPGEACWCATVALDPAALAAIPAESVGKHCICAGCGGALREAADDR
tara:strand:+ start:3047 stop:3265 length:219 start_codon:yes stop_codon:yes gene_type:complete